MEFSRGVNLFAIWSMIAILGLAQQVKSAVNVVIEPLLARLAA